MTLHMSDHHVVTLEQLRAFTEASRGIAFKPRSRKEAYAWMERILARFFYRTLRKRDKATVKTYLRQVTGYSDAQTTRLIGVFMRTRRIPSEMKGRRRRFPKVYTPEDTALLMRTDDAHGRLNGHATKEILRREYVIFRRMTYERLSKISVSHLYNLRGTRQYRSHCSTFTKTNPTTIPIGERRRPDPCGKPGFLRVDSVHQGDLDKEKGVYHINLVDEVTQWEVVGCVEGISEYFLAPLLEMLFEQFPFKVIGFHSDNGSEYINYVVAKLLNKLSIDQTKSRPRRSNDQALVEGKNGSVIRKHFGYAHISRRHASKINTFYQDHFNPYLNFHRPSGYATTTTDTKGKERKTYETYQTPYARFRSLARAETCLRDGVDMETLDQIATLRSDTEAAILMQEAKYSLFKVLRAA